MADVFPVKLHLGMLDGFGPAYPPGLLRIELQNAAGFGLVATGSLAPVNASCSSAP